MAFEIRLSRFIKLKVLKDIQESFSIATGLATVFADAMGNPINDGSNYSSFCKKLKTNSLGRDCCKFSNYLAGQKSKALKRPYIYKCHAGLIDISVPIIVNNQFLGTMIAGQVKNNDLEYNNLEKMPSPFDWLKSSEYQDMYSQIEVVSRQRIEATANTLFVIVNFIVEKSISELTQMELTEQKENLLKEIQARAELEKLLKEAELKALQNQINPHFMFNILNTVNRLISLQQYHKAQDVLTAFTKMLRYSLRNFANNQSIVTLRQELDYVEKYLLIQNLRFGDRIKYSIEIDPRLFSLEIPFFSLQPLVENAIVHGLEPKESGGTVYIIGKAEDAKAVIIIRDNGVGMKDKRLKAYLSNDEHSPMSNNLHDSIGISNVYNRLKLIYGNMFDFHLASNKGHGTTVTLTFLER